MQPIKTRGIVLRAQNMGEADKMLTVLSAELGKISVSAKGIKSLKHASRSSGAPFCYSEFVLKPRGEIYTLVSATLSESFYGLRKNVEHLALATYFLSLTDFLAMPGDNAGDILRVLLNSLYYLEKGLKKADDLRLFLEVRELSAAGFLPDMSCCAGCGSDRACMFDISAGMLFCRGCAPANALKLSEDCARLISFYGTSPLKTALDFDGEAAALEGTNIIEKFIRRHIGNIKALNYYLSISELGIRDFHDETENDYGKKTK